MMDHQDYRHITTIKRPAQKKSKSSKEPKTFVKDSFSIETATNLSKLSDAEFQKVSALAGNSSRGTFAQRARAAELQAARALRESKINPEGVTSSSSSDKNTVTLKMPRKQKWAPLDLTASAEDNTKTVPATSSSTAKPTLTESRLKDIEAFMKSEYGQKQYEKLKRQEAMLRKKIQWIPSSEDKQILESTTTKQQDYHSKTLNSAASSISQTPDLSEYPAELGARIAKELTPQLYPPGFQPLKYHPIQGRALTMQASSGNNENFGQQNTNLSKIGDAIRDNEQQNLTNQFAHASMALTREGQFYPDTSNYPSQSTTFVPNVNTNPIPGRSYPAVKGTPMAVENSNAMHLSNPYNPQGFQSQNWNTMPSQEFGYGAQGYAQHGNHSMAQRSHMGMEANNSFLTDHMHQGVANPFLTGQTHHQGSVSPFHNREPAGFLPQASGYSQPTQPTASMGNQSRNPEPPFPPPGFPFQVDRRYLEYGPGERQTEQDLAECMENPFKPREKLTREQERAKMEKEVKEWWTRDNRVPAHEKRQLEDFLANERRSRMQAPHPFGAIGSNISKADFKGKVPVRNKTDETKPKVKTPYESYTNEEMVNDLLVPAMANLMSYKTDKTSFANFGPPPSWAIDHTSGGNESFFSQQWGQPPQRVGRDPRYRAMQHDGRSSVFEDPTGRFPREEFTHDRGRGTGQGSNQSAGQGAGRGNTRWGAI